MTTQPRGARQRPHTAAVGASKGVAEGVVSVLRPGPHRPDGRRPVAWLNVYAPPDWRVVPTAHSWCRCGRDERAAGRKRVAALVAGHTAHRDTCPLRNPQEGRAAA
ncbi:hypothetical protein [Streptomyces johnsoniae]|uniref:Uncharacterized protein n=1 Tax=Streptomyces johnsoniae TaxID=3075532 RepID=A0ABU2SAZ1_9ACTN|nr:hypothetical protein [Streptomyces sp. DSM 41886]MDT0445968.1 hypothetical protein [Streptomyces sp. DSM 41886]